MRTKELILSHDIKRTSAETFVYETINSQESQLGNLYIIGWSTGDTINDFLFIPSLVVSAIRKTFYKLPVQNPDTRFASCLKQANIVISDLETTNKKIKGNIGFCVVNITKDKLYLASIGKVSAILFRKNTVNNIIGKAKNNRKKTELFSSVVSCSVLADDVLYFSTPDITDLFSKDGIHKLFDLSIENRANILQNIYEKNSKISKIPDQALIMLDIEKITEKRWDMVKQHVHTTVKNQKLLLFKNPLHFFTLFKKQKLKQNILLHFKKNIKEFYIKLKKSKKYLIAPNKKVIIYFIIIVIVTMVSIFYITITKQFKIIYTLQNLLNTAKTEQNKTKASAVLQKAQNIILTNTSPFYLSHSLTTLANQINNELSIQNNIFINLATEFAQLNISSLIFTPRFIFNTQKLLYIFGDSPDLFYTIDKNTKIGLFTILPKIVEPFYTERMFMKNGYFYSINDTKKSAYLLDVSDNDLIFVIKTITETLTIKSELKSKEMPLAFYTLSGARALIKEAKNQNEKKERFLLSAINTPIIDFSISENEKDIFLLTQDAIFILQ